MQVLSAAAQARLHAYLTRATFGLTGEQKQAVWDELEEHVLTRADHLCAFGTPYPQALVRALAELGPPQTVSAGMIKVYLMPKVMILTALAAVGMGSVAWIQFYQDEVYRDEIINVYTQGSLCASAPKNCNRSLFDEDDNSKISPILKSRPAIEKSAADSLLRSAGLRMSIQTDTVDGVEVKDSLVIKKNHSSRLKIYDYFTTEDGIYYNLASIIKAIANERPETSFSNSPLLEAIRK